ncbi:MAG: hypothetical protein JWR21_1048 [Herminiimonas sp.]|nr:hypothetical protein [Herminiimonas sp.]
MPSRCLPACWPVCQDVRKELQQEVHKEVNKEVNKEVRKEVRKDVRNNAAVRLTRDCPGIQYGRVPILIPGQSHSSFHLIK